MIKDPLSPQVPLPSEPLKELYTMQELGVLLDLPFRLGKISFPLPWSKNTEHLLLIENKWEKKILEYIEPL